MTPMHVFKQSRTVWSLIASTLLILTLGGQAMAQPDTQVRDSIPDKYKWDLSHIYADWAAWEVDMVQMQALMDEYAALKGTLADGPQAILKASKMNDELGMILYKVFRYPSLMSAQDTRDNEVSGKFQQIQIAYSKFGVATAWYSPELLEIPLETMEGWINDTPELEPYRYGLEDLYRQQEHVLSADKEELLALYSQSNQAAGNIYSELTTSDIKYPSTVLSDGDSVTLTPGTYYNILQTNRNQADRATAFEAFYGTYVDNANTYAAIYNGIMQRNWASAQARSYNSVLESYLDGDNVPVEVYEALVSTVRNGTGPVRRYYNLVRERLGLDEYHLYDGMIPLVDFDKTYDYDEIQEWIIESVAPLGEAYQARVREAFDNRWIDVYENEGKRTGAFCAGTYGVHPYMLLNFNGTLSDVFTVAHEMGHVMHSILSAEGQPFVNHDPTIFVAEVASTMNESLLLDYMLERTDDPIERIALLTHTINGVDGTFYTQSMWADFELRAHRMVEQGQPVTADAIRDLYSGIQQEYYGDAVTIDEKYRYVWTRIGHFYRQPFYVYKYATCYCTSAKLAAEISSDDKAVSKDALDRYMTLLGAGASDHPMELLKSSGVDLGDAATMQAIVDQLDYLVNLLEGELAKL
jgi:oligoendopeptidase F